MEKIFVGYAQITRRVEPDEDKQRVHDQVAEESSTADVTRCAIGEREKYKWQGDMGYWSYICDADAPCDQCIMSEYCRRNGR